MSPAHTRACHPDDPTMPCGLPTMGVTGTGLGQPMARPRWGDHPGPGPRTSHPPPREGTAGELQPAIGAAPAGGSVPARQEPSPHAHITIRKASRMNW
jgi:hypothetical protein